MARNVITPLSDQLILAFVPKYNSEGKKDATGAFHPEAAAFKALARPGGAIYQFDNNKPMAARRKEILRVLEGCTDDYVRMPTTVAFFCHGWADGIQAGFTRKTVGELARAISLATGGDNGTVPLFCCSTGDDEQDDPLESAGFGDNSFADKLRDALCAEGETYCRVMAHSKPAHTTMNPKALFFEGMGVPDGGVGGYAPVGPKSPNWAAWKRALQKTDLRFRFSYMTPAEIHAELSK
jgi:hypothetical protein